MHAAERPEKVAPAGPPYLVALVALVMSSSGWYASI